MPASSQNVIRDALALPEDERVKVVHELLESLSPEANERLDSLWEAELERRYADALANPAKGIPWSEVKRLQ